MCRMNTLNTTIICQGGSEQQYQVEHQLVFMKLLNSGTKGRIIMQKVFGYAISYRFVSKMFIQYCQWGLHVTVIFAVCIAGLTR